MGVSRWAVMGWSLGWAGLQRTEVSDAMAAQRAATAFAPSGPMPLLLRPNSWTLLTVLPRIASHSMRVPSSRKLFPPTKILVTDAQTEIYSASGLAMAEPSLSSERSHVAILLVGLSRRALKTMVQPSTPSSFSRRLHSVSEADGPKFRARAAWRLAASGASCKSPLPSDRA